jgi:dihydropteroate synthase
MLAAPAYWQTTRYQLRLDRPLVMGIVNVTPDSFSDGGQFLGEAAAIRHCEQLLAEGADLLDIGAESSRPGAPPVPLDEELRRVLPVVRSALQLGCAVSVDTYKPQVMQAVLDMGVDIINDIWALRQPGALQAVAAHPSCGLCLMHMHREPQTMQTDTMQGDVVQQVGDFLKARVQAVQALGFGPSQVAVDPGIGFGKTVDKNFSLLASPATWHVAGCVQLVGWSRKSSLAAVVADGLAGLAEAAALSVQGRLVPSVVAAVLAVERGAQVVRVHDVRATVQAMRVVAKLRSIA